MGIEPALRHAALVAALLVVGAPFSALAQGSTDAGTPPTAAEVDEIERALRADAQPAPPPAAPSGFSLQSLNPDLSFIADIALAWFSEEKPLQTGAHDPRQTGFTLQQLEMSVGASVDPFFRFDANIVFAQFGVEVEEVYATTLALPGGFQMRAGQFLTRFGRMNNTHPHAWSFLDQPFALGRIFGGEGNRGVGIEASYLTPLPWYVELVASGSDASGEGTARSFFGGERFPVRLPGDLQYTAALKQFFPLSDDWSVLWGLSGATGPNPTGYRNRTELLGTDLYVKFRPLSEASPTVVSLQAEWIYRRRQVPGDILRDSSGYAELFWRFAPRWGTAARYEYGSPARGLDRKVAEDPLDPEWMDDRHRVSASATFWPTEFSRVRLQGSTDLPGWKPTPTWAAMLNFEFAVGAHGAHVF